MDIVYFSYPRIPLVQATKLWSEMRLLTLAEITQKCDNVNLIGTEFYPLAEIRAEEEELRFIRAHVIEAAQRHGFPNAVSSRYKIKFESELIEIFHDKISMSPAEASNMDVWHYFNLILLADIAVWRWGSYSDSMNQWSITPDRLYGFTRNMFGRIWWRNHLLGPKLAVELGEDATVAIVERPILFNFPPFAKAVAARAVASETSASPTHLLRMVTPLLSRKMAVLSIFAMEIDILESFVHDSFCQVESMISKSSPQT